MREMDKLHALYDSLMDARRERGRRGRAVPPVRGAGVKDQVTKLRETGSRRWRSAWR